MIDYLALALFVTGLVAGILIGFYLRQEVAEDRTRRRFEAEEAAMFERWKRLDRDLPRYRSSL